VLARLGSTVPDTPVKTLDCIGLQCPLPVIKTAQAIKEIPMGEVLELLASDPGVEPDMKAWTRRTGNELISLEKIDQIFRVLIRKAK
jgi:tRNA 2-thiouridine synthesizing protein A